MTVSMTAHPDGNGTVATDALSGLERRALRSWRMLLVAYIVPMTVATHWPRLGFGAGGPIDKFSHFLGFGMLAWMALHAVPRRRALLAWLAAVAWVYIDERTQAIPALGRVFSLNDMIAGWLGVAFAGMLYAVRAKSEPAEVRARIYAWTYGRPGHWLLAAAIVLAVILTVGGAMFASAVRGGAPAEWPVAVYPVGFSGLMGLAVATAVVERIAGREAGRPARPAWTALVVIPAMCVLYGAYLALCLGLFGAEPSGDDASDALGFEFLRRTVLVVSAIVALAFARAVGLRARAR